MNPSRVFKGVNGGKMILALMIWERVWLQLIWLHEISSRCRPTLLSRAIKSMHKDFAWLVKKMRNCHQFKSSSMYVYETYHERIWTDDVWRSICSQQCQIFIHCQLTCRLEKLFTPFPLYRVNQKYFSSEYLHVCLIFIWGPHVLRRLMSFVLITVRMHRMSQWLLSDLIRARE